MINKSASKVGSIRFAANMNVVSFYLGTNSNTGENILWQSLNGQKARKFTGKNIAKLYDEVYLVTKRNEAYWCNCDAKLLALWGEIK